jgi:hypothetical protein
MEALIIFGVESDCESGFSVTAGSFVVNRSVKSKNVLSNPSVQYILITYSEAALTSMFEFSDKIREASENECASNKMKRKYHSAGTITNYWEREKERERETLSH